jgi:hypothetical protein
MYVKHLRKRLHLSLRIFLLTHRALLGVLICRESSRRLLTWGTAARLSL